MFSSTKKRFGLVDPPSWIQLPSVDPQNTLLPGHHDAIMRAAAPHKNLARRSLNLSMIRMWYVATYLASSLTVLNLCPENPYQNVHLMSERCGPFVS